MAAGDEYAGLDLTGIRHIADADLRHVFDLSAQMLALEGMAAILRVVRPGFTGGREELLGYGLSAGTIDRLFAARDAGVWEGRAAAAFGEQSDRLLRDLDACEKVFAHNAIRLKVMRDEVVAAHRDITGAQTRAAEIAETPATAPVAVVLTEAETAEARERMGAAARTYLEEASAMQAPPVYEGPRVAAPGAPADWTTDTSGGAPGRSSTVGDGTGYRGYPPPTAIASPGGAVPGGTVTGSGPTLEFTPGTTPAPGTLPGTPPGGATGPLTPPTGGVPPGVIDGPPTKPSTVGGRPSVAPQADSQRTAGRPGSIRPREPGEVIGRRGEPGTGPRQPGRTGDPLRSGKSPTGAAPAKRPEPTRDPATNWRKPAEAARPLRHPEVIGREQKPAAEPKPARRPEILGRRAGEPVDRPKPPPVPKRLTRKERQREEPDSPWTVDEGVAEVVAPQEPETRHWHDPGPTLNDPQRD